MLSLRIILMIQWMKSLYVMVIIIDFYDKKSKVTPQVL